MSPEQLLMKHILTNHSRIGRPVMDPQKAVKVSVQLHLSQLIRMVTFFFHLISNHHPIDLYMNLTFKRRTAQDFIVTLFLNLMRWSRSGRKILNSAAALVRFSCNFHNSWTLNKIFTASSENKNVLKHQQHRIMRFYRSKVTSSTITVVSGRNRADCFHVRLVRFCKCAFNTNSQN